MSKKRTLAISIAAMTLTACAGGGPQDRIPTRAEVSPLGFHATPALSDGLSEQADALNASARAIVRASTVKGAVIGAAVGCGVGLLSASNASACLGSGAVGAVGGAVAGNIAGKRDVARRIELASPNALVRNLRKANSSMEVIERDLPRLLAEQDAELNALTLAFAAREISPTEHDRRVEVIRAERAALAQALLLTTNQAAQASTNLKQASAKGHSGLEWHIGATDQLARQATSARASITLL